MVWLSGVLVLALVSLFALCAGAASDLDPALLPLPTLGGAAVLLLIAGCAGVLRLGLWLVLAALLAGSVYCGVRAGRGALRRAALSPGLLLFAGGSLFFWLLFAVQQPMFTQWDEFTAWGLAPKMVKQLDALYVARPYNLTAYHTLPGTSLICYLFLALSPAFGEWQCLAALDTLALACAAAAAGLGEPRRRWPAAVLVFAAGALLPFFFSVLPAGTPGTVYASAMADVPMGLVFGGALCLYHNGRAQKGVRAGVLLALPALALLTLLKDIAFAYGLIAAFLLALDALLCAPRPRPRALLWLPLAALPVLAAFLGWSRYTALADPQSAAAVGAAGLSYGQVLTGGLRQLLGLDRSEGFARLMALMGQALWQRRVSLLGSGARVLLLAALLTAAAALTAPRAERTARRRPLVAGLGLAICFAALYLFHLILYHYNFAELEAFALKDYERYLQPYYSGWLLVLLALLGQSAAADRRGGWALAAVTAGLTVLVAWRGVPTAGFWSGADSLYTLRADVQRRAAAANAALDWDDRVLVLSQGDDATRWYYYKYELTATVVDGYGGIWWGDDDRSHRWDSDFMNLVESLNWERYDFKAVGSVDSLAAYMEEKDCPYLLIDRADDYLERDFSARFEGGLRADMPATLYRLGADGRFVPVAVLESGVQP